MEDIVIFLHGFRNAEGQEGGDRDWDTARGIVNKKTLNC